MSFSTNNIIENSSFEVGYHGWGLSNAIATTAPINQLDTGNGWHGSNSLKIESSQATQNNEICSKLYRLKENTQYTLSFYAKTDKVSPYIWIGVRNSFAGAGDPGDEHLSEINITADWARYSYTFTTADVADKTTYYIIFWASGTEAGKYIWIDALQVEEGDTPTDYYPKEIISIGVDSGKDGNVFYETDTIAMTLNLFNNDSESHLAKIYYRVYDYYNAIVKSGTVNKTVASEAPATEALNLTMSSNKRGAFRILAWCPELSDGYIFEMNYSVIPEPQTLDLNSDSMFGSHIPFEEYYLSLAQKCGIKWNRTLSTGQQFRWSVAEPTEDGYVFFDAEMQLAKTYGIKVLGVLGSETIHVPTWAKGNGYPTLANWYDFVYDMVDHYNALSGGEVDHWEIWNEPDTEGGLGADPGFYADLLEQAYSAAKAADPDCTVVGMVAYSNDWIAAIIADTGTNDYDSQSTHTYPEQEANAKIINDNFLVPDSKDGWNSETGAIAKTFYQTVLWEDQYGTYGPTNGGSYRQRTDVLIQNFAQCMGLSDQWKKYIYYDARQTTSIEQLTTYSLFEWDGTLRPRAVAYSVLAKLFDGSAGQGEESLDASIKAYKFLNGATPLMILWVTDYKTMKKVSTSYTGGEVVAYDIMGNELSLSSGLEFGYSPIYLKGVGITLTQLVDSLSIDSEVDSTPPNLSIVTFPLGTFEIGSDLIFRWVAVDNIARIHTSPDQPDTILYSYNLNGSVWSEWGNVKSVKYENYGSQLYTFQVKAKDYAGNTSTIGISTINTFIQEKHMSNRIPLLGKHGFLLVTDTTAQSGGNWSSIYIVEETIFTSLTGGYSLGTGSALADATFAAGEIIVGNFTAFELASGAVIAYNAE